MGLIPGNMQPLKSICLPCKIGCDYSRDKNWTVKKRTIAGWKAYANKLAKQFSKRDGIEWNGVVMYVDHGNYYRISLGYQTV